MPRNLSEPVKIFDFLGITLQYEMCYTNVLQVLDLSGIPLLAKDRTEEDPIVIGGALQLQSGTDRGIFLIFSTSEREKLRTGSCWTFIKK